jgi:hypothetical protein
VIVHLVLFRPKAGLSDADRRGLADALNGAAHEIPGVRRVRVGRRVTHGRPYEQLMRVDYSHAAILEFDDLDGLQTYLRHPAHEALASRFFAAFEEGLFYDFELEDGDEGARKLLA